ncbi:MAG: DUF4012 domain-containing protein [Acidimicrobiales bacterium]|nr:DUF4012 domain-containing protein [Acidimicrobiales bacterium]
MGVAWLAASAWLVLSARAEMVAAADELRAVRREASVATLVEADRIGELAEAEGRFRRASDRLGSPLLAPWRVAPVAGRHLGAARDLAQAGEEGSAAAAVAVEELQALTDRPRGAGPERIETLTDLATVADDTGAALGDLDLPSGDSLVGPLADAVVELAEQRDDAVDAADRLSGTATALADLLSGPEPYLLLGANNAEMRVGSGMYLSAAELGFVDGDLELGDVVATADLVLPEGAVDVEGDLAENWAWLDVGRDLRSLGLSPDLPANAEVAVETWAAGPAASGAELGGVVVVDVDALRGLLRVVGPVEVDGVRYDADNVRGELLREQYRRFAGEREARKDQLGEVARAVFDRLDAGDWALEDLATELVELAAGRHVMVWSADPEVQETWTGSGVGGALDPASTSIGLANRSGSKLDSWVETAADITVDGRDIEIRYEIRNTAPDTGSRQLVGPIAEGLDAGDHRALVVANLPAGTTDVTIEGAELVLQGGDGPTVVVAGDVTLASGESGVVTVRGTLPEGLDHLRLEPSARIPRTEWSMDGTPLDRDRRQTIDLTQ